MIDIAVKVCQLLVAMVLLDVWILRVARKTPYRGGDAVSMKEEFAAYGLPQWSVYAVGVVKVACALGLLFGLIFPSIVLYPAAVIAMLMIGAIAMHIKVRDPLLKSLPALALLVLSLFIGFGILL